MSSDQRQFRFEWDEVKVAANMRKHEVRFKLACSVFDDPRLLTNADVEHSETGERWFSIGNASHGALLPVVYCWFEVMPLATKVRMISTRKASANEVRQYEEHL